MTMRYALIALLGSLAFGSPALAQRPSDRAPGKERGGDIPKAYRPPPGMCRVWLDDVPPGQQPAPTDCKSALRNKPAKARVIFGDDYVDADRKRQPSLTGFTGRDEPGEKAAARPRWRRP